MLIRRDALARAKRFRTCPPARMRHDPGEKPFFDRHLRICPFCSKPAQQEDPWRDLFDRLRMLLGSSSPAYPSGQPSPGEVREIKPEKASWRNGMHYNPPLVLVVENTEPAASAVLVAQTYHDIAMAAPGDLIVEYPGAPEQSFFIQTWNVYTLRSSDLGPTLLNLSPEALDAVQKLRSDQAFLPRGFQVPVQMRENDTRLYFREIEVETAYTFSSPAVSGLVAEIEAHSLVAHVSVKEARDGVKTISPEAFWIRTPETAIEALLFARIPDDRLSLAADDGAESGLFAALYVLHKGNVVALSPLRFRIFGDLRTGDVRAMSGKVTGGCQELQNTDFLCLCTTSSAERIVPSRVEWDDETGSFYVEFPVAGSEMADGEIFVALIKEADGV